MNLTDMKKLALSKHLKKSGYWRVNLANIKESNYPDHNFVYDNNSYKVYTDKERIEVVEEYVKKHAKEFAEVIIKKYGFERFLSPSEYGEVKAGKESINNENKNVWFYIYQQN